MEWMSRVGVWTLEVDCFPFKSPRFTSDSDVDGIDGGDELLFSPLLCNLLSLVDEMLDRGSSMPIPGGRCAGAAQAPVRSRNIETLALVLGKVASVYAQRG